MDANPATELVSATFEAACDGYAHAVAAWLDGGGRVDARREPLGATLLMAAAGGGHEAMVRMLLQRGASVNLQNFLGCTALMNTAFKDHATVAQALLDAKADASIQSNSGVQESEQQKSPRQQIRAHININSALKIS